MNRNRQSIIAGAALAALAGMPLYANKPDDSGGAGGGGKDDPPPQPKPNEAPKLQLTEAELQQKIADATNAALAAERKKREEADAKALEEGERKKAEEQGEYQKLAEADRAKREAAEQQRDEAIRRAQLAEVNIQLRDYLAADDRKQFLANAPDIMLHVEKELAPDAKSEDVAKLIEKKTAEFVARTAPAKAGAQGAPSGGARGKLPAGQGAPAPKPQQNGKPITIGTAGMRF
jgi:membrane protein involved in colicin uptake